MNIRAVKYSIEYWGKNQIRKIALPSRKKNNFQPITTNQLLASSTEAQGCIEKRKFFKYLFMYVEIICIDTFQFDNSMKTSTSNENLLVFFNFD